MSTSALAKDAAVPAGDVSVATLAWRFRGVVRVTAIAKATFAFAPDGAMPRVAPQPILRTEVHHGNSPARSIRLTTDLAPYLNRADVVLTGHAHAPRDARVETLPVRLGVFNGTEAVVDKTVLVRLGGGVDRVPLVYERAYGGLGWADNPLGVGLVEGSGEPTLLDPSDGKSRAGFAPIGQGWPARKRLLGGTKRLALDVDGIVELPDELDWEYFQSAPADQRVAFLRGDEWIVMDRLHPRHARLRTCLPGARALALVHGLAPWGVADGQPVALHADTLRIDADEERCTLTFRASFPVADEAALPHVRVVMGIELPGQPVAWPTPASILSPAAESPDGDDMPLSVRDFVPSRSDVLEGTLSLESEPADASPPAVGHAPGTPQSTLCIEPDSPKPALPFQGSVSAPSVLRQPSAPRARARRTESAGTLLQTPEDEAHAVARSVLPFEETTPAAPPPAPAPLPAAAPAPEQPGARWSWAPAPAPAPTPAASRMPPPPPPGPRAVSPLVKMGLYQRFGGKR